MVLGEGHKGPNSQVLHKNLGHKPKWEKSKINSSSKLISKCAKRFLNLIAELRRLFKDLIVQLTIF